MNKTKILLSDKTKCAYETKTHMTDEEVYFQVTVINTPTMAIINGIY